MPTKKLAQLPWLVLVLLLLLAAVLWLLLPGLPGLAVAVIAIAVALFALLRRWGSDLRKADTLDDEIATPPQHHHEPAPDQHGHPGQTKPSGGHGAPFTVTIDGRSFDAHMMAPGRLHTHELPFMLFSTPEDLARGIVNKLAWQEPHGHAEKPEEPPQS